MGNRIKVWLVVEAVCAAIVASLICWRFHFSWIVGHQGLHGDWFWFFLGVFVPLMLITLTRSGDIKWKSRRNK
jgi:hypothetical protein